MTAPYTPPSVYDAADGVEAGFDDRRPLAPEGTHLVVIEEANDFRGGAAKTLYAKFNYEILEPQPGSVNEDGSAVRAGQKHAAMEKMDQHQYPEHANKALAWLKASIAACFGIGLDRQDLIAKEVTGKVITGVMSNRAVLNGHVVRAQVIHKSYTSKKAGSVGKIEKIAVHQFFPVLNADGTPRKHAVALPEERPAAAAYTAPATQGYVPPAPNAGGFVPPAPVPAAAPAPVAFPPAGWLEHPTSKGQFYNPGRQMTTCIGEGELRAAMALGKA